MITEPVLLLLNRGYLVFQQIKPSIKRALTLTPPVFKNAGRAAAARQHGVLEDGWFESTPCNKFNQYKMALNFFGVRVIIDKTMSYKDIDIVTVNTEKLRKELKAEINGDSKIDFVYKDLDTVQQVYQVYCKQCNKIEAATKFGGGFKCIVCWTVRTGRHRTHINRRQKWSK